MKRATKIIFSLAIAIVCGFVGVTNVNATSLKEGAQAAKCDDCPSELFGDAGVFSQITNTILYIVGIIAVIMLIWGGVRYVVSGGDAKKVTDAKNTILYAIIGLIISFLAYAIVHFVVSALPSDDTEKDKPAETSMVLDTHC